MHTECHGYRFSMIQTSNLLNNYTKFKNSFRNSVLSSVLRQKDMLCISMVLWLRLLQIFEKCKISTYNMVNDYIIKHNELHLKYISNKSIKCEIEK